MAKHKLIDESLILHAKKMASDGQSPIEVLRYFATKYCIADGGGGWSRPHLMDLMECTYEIPREDVSASADGGSTAPQNYQMSRSIISCCVQSPKRIRSLNTRLAKNSPRESHAQSDSMAALPTTPEPTFQKWSFSIADMRTIKRAAISSLAISRSSWVDVES